MSLDDTLTPATPDVGFDYEVVVVGAGAAGLVAAERAATRGRRTLLLEKNRKPGVKILMSGGTRCNLTHNTDSRGIVKAYGPPGRFLHSALASLSPQDLVALVEGEGVPTKVEETGEIFPASDRALDILQAFLKRLERSGCPLALAEPLRDVEQIDGGFRLTTASRTLTTQKLIVTTGGQSYPGSGTSGDGYRWATKLGHTIIPPRPALVPITTGAEWVKSLSGVTLPDVEVRVIESGYDLATTKPPGCLDTRRGSFLFTHFGLSGPVVLDISCAVTGHPEPQTLRLAVDFVPAVKEAALDESWREALARDGKKTVAAILPDVVPRRLGEVLLQSIGIAPDMRLAELPKRSRAALLQALKRTAIPVAGTRGFSKAEVTAGGVSLDEVDSRTMESKLVPGLYWAGEVLDLDGPIGGFNFQAAFSTGWLAGKSV